MRRISIVIALVLASSSWLGSARAQTPPSAGSGTVAVDGGQIYYEARGEGPVVVFLHGGFLDGRMWDREFDLLAPSHRVIRVDARGHGRSSVHAGNHSHVDDLYTVLAALGVKRATLVGLSLGARTAIDFALVHPDMVDGLVAAAPGVSGWEFQDPTLLAHWEGMNRAAEADDGAMVVEWFLRSWVDGPKRTPEQSPAAVRNRVKTLALENLPKQSAATGHVEEVGAMDRLGELRVPVLAIVGERDMSDIHAIVDRLAAKAPRVRKVVIPGAGHMLNLERPAEFDRLLLGYLARPTPKPPSPTPSPG